MRGIGRGVSRMACALALIGVGAAAQAGDLYQRAVDPITKSFARTTIKWQGAGLNGETMIVYGVEEHAGRIAVCGLHISRGRIDRVALMNGLRRSSITSGGHALVTDLSYFDEFSGERDYFRLVCQVTRFRWDPAYGRVKPKYVQGVEFYDPPD